MLALLPDLDRRPDSVLRLSRRRLAFSARFVNESVQVCIEPGRRHASAPCRGLERLDVIVAGLASDERTQVFVELGRHGGKRELVQHSSRTALLGVRSLGRVRGRDGVAVKLPFGRPAEVLQNDIMHTCSQRVWLYPNMSRVYKTNLPVYIYYGSMDKR